LDGSADVPPWAGIGEFSSITRTRDELSIVCPQGDAPPETKGERDWRCVRIAGTVDFSAVGVLASLLVPLAEAGISVFAVSTFDTDYLLVKDSDLEEARAVLGGHGHSFG
jgi:hypothetical protein